MFTSARAPRGAGAAHPARGDQCGQADRDPAPQDLGHLPVRRLGRARLRRRLGAVCQPRLRGRAPAGPGNTMTPTFTRGPGQAAGVFTLECAMDEAGQPAPGSTPLSWRLRNLAETDPNTGNPWSSSGLRECLQRGASRIGWERRNPAPRSERDGNWLIGTGMAAAALPGSVLHAHPAGPRSPVRRRHRRRGDLRAGVRHGHDDGANPGGRRRARHRPGRYARGVRRH